MTDKLISRLFVVGRDSAPSIAVYDGVLESAVIGVSQAGVLPGTVLRMPALPLSLSAVVVFGEQATDVCGIARYVPRPWSESAVLVDGLDPLVEELSLGLVLLRVLPLDLKD